jgi:hypothetical protein
VFALADMALKAFFAQFPQFIPAFPIDIYPKNFTAPLAMGSKMVHSAIANSCML